MRVIRHEIIKIWNLRALAIVFVLCSLYFFGANIPQTLREIRDPQGAIAADYLRHIKPYRLEQILCKEHLEWQRQFYSGAIESEDLFVYAAEQRILLEFTPASNFIERKHEHLNALELNLEYFNDQELVRGFSINNLERTNQLELTERQYTRITEVLENNEWHSELHGNLFWSFTDLVRQIGLLLIIASLALHSTLVTNDRMRNILPLQYHTKVGRRIGIRQFAAVLLSSLILSTVAISVVAVILARSGMFAYWNEGITSYLTVWGFNSLSVAFWPISFGSYILIMAALCYALCIGTAATAFFLSRFSRNLISLTIKTVPVFTLLAYMHSLVLPNRWTTDFIDRFTAPLTLFNDLYMRTGIAHLDVIIISAFVVISVLVAAFVARRERNLEAL